MPTIGEVVDKEMYDENERLKERLATSETALRNLVAAAEPVIGKWNDLVCNGFLDGTIGQPEWDEFIVRLDTLESESTAAKEVLKK